MGIERDGSSGDNAGTSVTDLTQSAWEPGTAGYIRKCIAKGLGV